MAQNSWRKEKGHNLLWQLNLYLNSLSVIGAGFYGECNWRSGDSCFQGSEFHDSDDKRTAMQNGSHFSV